MEKKYWFCAAIIALTVVFPAIVKSEITYRRTAGENVLKGGGTVNMPNGKPVKICVFKDVKAKRVLGDERYFHGYIQLQATGNDVSKCRWLQFTYASRKKADGKEVGGDYSVWAYSDSFVYRFGPEGRHVDGKPGGLPFYDAEGMNNRSTKETSIFDSPNVDLKEEQGFVEGRAIFDTFLICSGKVVYHVHWEMVGHAENGQIKRSYEKISGKAADGLPPWGQGDELPGGFRRKSNGQLVDPFSYKNPLKKSARKPSGSVKKKIPKPRWVD